MKIRDLLPLVGAAPLALLLLGCPFSPDQTKPVDKPRYKPQTSPENVLDNLQTAYKYREIGAFDSLLYDSQASGDTTEGYTFRFWGDDVQRDPNIPPTWGREEEISSARAMFSASDVERIDVIALDHNESYDDNTVGHEGQKIIYVTNASLDVTQRMPNQPEPTIWRVESNFARFRFKTQWVNSKGESLWRIIYWEDLGAGSGKMETPSLVSFARDRASKLASPARGQAQMTAREPTGAALLLRNALLAREPK